MRNLAAILILPLLLAPVAQAQPVCEAPPAVWSTDAALTSAAAPAGLGKARLAPDHAATVALHPAGEVTFLTAPEKPGDAASYGGMLAVEVRDAGSYQVGLSAGAWVDVLKDSKAVASSAHGHGPECSTLRKMVSFALTPGHYVIQLSGNKDSSLRVMILRQQ